MTLKKNKSNTSINHHQKRHESISKQRAKLLALQNSKSGLSASHVLEEHDCKPYDQLVTEFNKLKHSIKLK